MVLVHGYVSLPEGIMIHSVPLLQETAGGLLEFELLRRLLEQASSYGGWASGNMAST